MSKKSQTEHLEKLLQFVPPRELRQSVEKTLFSYLLGQDEKVIDADYKKVVEDHFFLLDFLNKLES